VDERVEKKKNWAHPPEDWSTMVGTGIPAMVRYSESHLGGAKYDDGKAPEHLYSLDAHKRLLEVLRRGASKYGERNWESGMAWSRVYAALERHLHAWWSGESIDPETGLSHLAHAMANMMFLNHYEALAVGKDDRPNSSGVKNK